MSRMWYNVCFVCEHEHETFTYFYTNDEKEGKLLKMCTRIKFLSHLRMNLDYNNLYKPSPICRKNL